MAKRTAEVINGMSANLSAFIRGEISFWEISDGMLWFNCYREHLFCDTTDAPAEASWALLEDVSEYAKSKVAIADLSPKATCGLNQFREAVLIAESRGNVSWRDQREQNKQK